MQNKVNYLRIILTEHCNLSCYFCHKEGCNVDKELLSTNSLIKLLRCFYKAGINKFKFMGGEPTLRNDLPLILLGMSDYSFSIDTSIITNGLFEQKFLEDCVRAGLNRVNVSIHAWNDIEMLKAVGMSDLIKNKLMNNLDFLIKSKRLSKLNYVVLKSKGYSELLELINWVNERKLILDVLNILYNNQSLELEEEFCDFEEIYQVVDKNYKIDNIILHENQSSLPSTRLLLSEGGIINLKTSKLNSFHPFHSCTSCNQYKYCNEGIKSIRLTADGYLKPCLFRDDNRLNLNDILEEADDKIIEIIKNYIDNL